MDDKINSIVPRDDIRHKPSRSGFCVLVVDSSRVCLTITTRILSINRYKVIVARYGAQALSMIRQSKIKIDLVLTEFQLPDMCGIDFMEKVREVKRMPVVFISSFGNPGEKMRCLSKGGDFCLEKPIAMKEASWLWQFKILNRRAATFGTVKELSSMKVEEVVGDNGYITSKKRRIFWATEFYGKSGEEINMCDANGNTIPKSTRMEELFRANASRMQNRPEGLQFPDSLNGTSIDTTLSLRVGSHENLHTYKSTQMDVQYRSADKGILKKDDTIKPNEESLLSLGLSLGFGSQIFDHKMNNTEKGTNGAKVEASDAASSSVGHGDLMAYSPIIRGRVPQTGSMGLRSNGHMI